jgi:hypothetical protein
MDRRRVEMLTDLLGPNFHCHLCHMLSAFNFYSPVCGGLKKQRLNIEILMTCPNYHVPLDFYYPMKMTNIYKEVLMWQTD